MNLRSNDVSVFALGVQVNHLSKRHPEMSIDDVPELTLPIIKPNRDYFCQYCDKVRQSPRTILCIDSIVPSLFPHYMLSILHDPRPLIHRPSYTRLLDELQSV